MIRRIIEAETIIEEKKKGASLEKRETFDRGLNWLDDKLYGLAPIKMGRAERAREAEPQAPASRNQSFVVTQTDGDAPAILTREGADKDRATAAEDYRQWQESIEGNVKYFAEPRDAERAVQAYGGQIMDCPKALQVAPRASRQPVGAEWAL